MCIFCSAIPSSFVVYMFLSVACLIFSLGKRNYSKDVTKVDSIIIMEHLFQKCIIKILATNIVSVVAYYTLD